MPPLSPRSIMAATMDQDLKKQLEVSRLCKQQKSRPDEDQTFHREVAKQGEDIVYRIFPTKVRIQTAISQQSAHPALADFVSVSFPRN